MKDISNARRSVQCTTTTVIYRTASKWLPHWSDDKLVVLKSAKTITRMDEGVTVTVSSARTIAQIAEMLQCEINQGRLVLKDPLRDSSIPTTPASTATTPSTNPKTWKKMGLCGTRCRTETPRTSYESDAVVWISEPKLLTNDGQSDQGDPEKDFD